MVYFQPRRGRLAALDFIVNFSFLNRSKFNVHLSVSLKSRKLSCALELHLEPFFVSAVFTIHVDTSAHCVPIFSDLWMWGLNSSG